ncbi:MAG TPA: hypothetical protein VKR32_06305 [Puia sp.]|nr:hypothetical protein [Puia sp.]
MISQANNVKMLVKDAEDCLKTEIEAIKLKSVDKSSDIISSLFASTVIIVAGLIFIIFLSAACCLLLRRLTGSLELGCFIIAALWGLICLLLYLTRKQLLKGPAQNAVIKKILE